MINLSAGTWEFRGLFSVPSEYADSPNLSSGVLLIETVTIPIAPTVYSAAGCYQLFQVNNADALGKDIRLKIGANLVIFPVETTGYKVRIFPYNWITSLDIKIWEFIYD